MEDINSITEGYGVLVRKDGKDGVVLPQSFKEYELTAEAYRYRADVYRGEYP